MDEQKLDKEAVEIKGELQKISRNTRNPVWRSFLTGIFHGLGSVIGAAIGLLIIGWILNSIGVIPAFKGEVTKLNQVLDQIQKNK